MFQFLTQGSSWPDGFSVLKTEEYGMPTRHISTQSFDEILSDLGDDPAIPDPHGIRKPNTLKGATPKPISQSQGGSFIEALNSFEIQNLIPKLGNLITLTGVLIAGLVAFFVATKAANEHSQVSLDESKKLIAELKRDMSLMRSEIEQDQNDLYVLIDELEVSIHSLKDKKPATKVFSKPSVSIYEAELRRWRFLGAAQMGMSHQAFFDTGKGNVTYEKGAQILGDWRLSNIEKDLVTLTHPQGKSLALKASKSE